MASVMLLGCCGMTLSPRVPAPCDLPLTSPPPGRSMPPRMSWASENWRWDQVDGDAHEMAQALRASLSTTSARVAFLSATAAGDWSSTVDWEAAKVVLALKCQRAANQGYDNDGQWQALLDGLVACNYEGGPSGDARLAQAICERVGPDDAHDVTPHAALASALAVLGFVERGLDYPSARSTFDLAS